MKLKVGKFVNWEEYQDYVVITNLLEGNIVKIKGGFNEEIKRLLSTGIYDGVDLKVIDV